MPKTLSLTQMAPHLAMALLVEREQVVERAIVDAAALRVVHVRARHRVRLPAARLPVREDANIVACAHMGANSMSRSILCFVKMS